MNKCLQYIDRLEENIIAALLGLMVLITFSQVIARYYLNTGWGSALELTQVLFAWLILFGMSYGIKVGAHLGVDMLVRKCPGRLFRVLSLLGALACIIYGVTLLSSEWMSLIGWQPKGGAYFYWSKMYTLNIGMESILLPEQWFGPDQRLPRWVAYLILPVGLALFVLRSIQAFFHILVGHRDMVIAAHEAEELLEKNNNTQGRE